jgi:copper transport protein
MRLRNAGIVLLVLFLAWLPPREADAHGSLISSEPADGLLLDAAPGEVILIFDEATELTALRLTAPDGSYKDAAAQPERLVSHRLALPRGTLQGTHMLSWRAVSEDGHPISGAVVFSVGRISAEPGTEIGTSRPVARALWLTRLAVAAGTAFGIGSAAFMLLLADGRWPGRLRMIVAGFLAIGVLGTVASIGLQGLDLVGAGLARLGDPTIWWAGLSRTPQGTSAVLAALAFAAAGFGIGSRSIAFALAALVLSGAAFAASGHAALASPRWLMQPAVFLHTIAMTLWLGALPPLATLARTDASALNDALRRFSEAIPYGLTLLFGSGLALAFVQLSSLPALWQTAYGKIFLVKLGLIAAVLALALLNRTLTPQVLTDDGVARRRLAVSIVAESLLTSGALGVVGLWRFTIPPRTLPPVVPDEVLSPSGEGLSARIRVRPPRAGKIRLLIEDIRKNSVRIAPRELALTLEKPSFGLGPFRKTVGVDSSGEFAAVDMFLPMDGIWVLRLDVLVDDYQEVSLRDVLTLAAG